MFKRLFFFGALSLGLTFTSVYAQTHEKIQEKVEQHQTKVANLMAERKAAKLKNITTKYNESGTVSITDAASWVQIKTNSPVTVDPSINTKTMVFFDIKNSDPLKAFQKMATENNLIVLDVAEVGYTLGNSDWTAEKAIELRDKEKKAKLEVRHQHEKEVRRIIEERRAKKNSTSVPSKSTPSSTNTVAKPHQKGKLVTVATNEGKVDSVMAILSTQINGIVSSQGTVSGTRVSILAEDVPIEAVLEKLCEDNKNWFWYQDEAGNYTIIDSDTLKSRVDEEYKSKWTPKANPHQIDPIPQIGSISDKNSPPVTAATSDGKLISVLEVIEKQVPVTFSCKGTVTGEERITILAKDKPMEIVLDMICKSNNWAWWKVSDTEYAISDLEYYKSNK